MTDLFTKYDQEVFLVTFFAVYFDVQIDFNQVLGSKQLIVIGLYSDF